MIIFAKNAQRSSIRLALTVTSVVTSSVLTTWTALERQLLRIKLWTFTAKVTLGARTTSELTTERSVGAFSTW